MKKIVLYTFLVIASSNCFSNTKSKTVDATDEVRSSGRVNFNGMGLSYSTIGGTSIYIGGIYEKVLSPKILGGVGFLTGFNSDWNVFGPQALIRYFFGQFDQRSFYLLSVASYTWKNYLDTREDKSKFNLDAGAGHQWIFGAQNNWFIGLGLILAIDNNYNSSPFLDLGFSF